MNLKIILYSLILCISIISCNNKETNKIYNKTKEQSNFQPKISFKNVTSLNKTNKKVIEIASVAFSNSNELKKSQLILKIKQDHQEIELELKKITSENLIIIPEPIFELKLNETFLKEVNSDYYLIALLEKEIQNQIILLDSIENATKNDEFRSFVDKSKNLLISNNTKLEKFL